MHVINTVNMVCKLEENYSVLKQEGKQCLLFLKNHHSLNLCGADSAESSTKAVACAGIVKTVYNLLHSIPKSQDTQQRQDGNSLQGLSGTGWTDCDNSDQSFTACYPGINTNLQKHLEKSKFKNDRYGFFFFFSPKHNLLAFYVFKYMVHMFLHVKVTMP